MSTEQWCTISAGRRSLSISQQDNDADTITDCADISCFNKTIIIDNVKPSLFIHSSFRSKSLEWYITNINAWIYFGKVKNMYFVAEYAGLR